MPCAAISRLTMLQEPRGRSANTFQRVRAGSALLTTHAIHFMAPWSAEMTPLKSSGAIVPEVSVLGADPIEDNRNYFGFEA